MPAIVEHHSTSPEQYSGRLRGATSRPRLKTFCCWGISGRLTSSPERFAGSEGSG
jgi:hypothetical protein